MSKPKLLLIRYAAFGDLMYMSPVLPLLFEKYDVYFETGFKGQALFFDDPRFKQKAYFAFEQFDPKEYDVEFAKRWEAIRKVIQPDREINLNGTCEVTCIAERYQEQFNYPVGHRRVVFGSTSFYDAVFERCGVEVPNPLETNGMWFSPEFIKGVEGWRERHKDKFVVILPLKGSTNQKFFHLYKETTEAILDKYPDALVYLAGDQNCRRWMIQHERVKPMFGDHVSMKQAVLHTKYADMVVGPETSLLAAAGMFGTPKVMLASTSSLMQLTKYQKNDFSIQAPFACSPCHRAIYRESDCERPIATDGDFTTSCSKTFKLDDIMDRVDWVYKNVRGVGK